jgi:hypothetical protein
MYPQHNKKKFDFKNVSISLQEFYISTNKCTICVAYGGMSGLSSGILQVKKAEVQIGAMTCLRSHSQSAGWNND